MNSLNAGTANELVHLAEEKLRYLYILRNSLICLDEAIETKPDAEVLDQITLQNECVEKISIIDMNYNFLIGKVQPDCLSPYINPITEESELLNWGYSLDCKIKEQKKVLTEIAALNKTAIEKAQKIYDIAKGKIKEINQKKDVLSGYASAKIHHTGVLLDYKK